MVFFLTFKTNNKKNNPIKKWAKYFNRPKNIPARPGKKKSAWLELPGGPVGKNCFPKQKAQVQSRYLRSRMLQGNWAHGPHLESSPHPTTKSPSVAAETQRS